MRILPFPYPRPNPGGSSQKQIRDGDKANYPSLQRFTGFFKQEDNHPSYTNLFSVHFSTPPILQYGDSWTNTWEAGSGNLKLLLDYYAQSVNLPSKQVTTGQAAFVGAPYKYATGSAFSQINITFMMPRSQYTRNFFERWTSLMANDANQYADYYENYCAPQIYIFKWERGGGDPIHHDPYMRRHLREKKAEEEFNILGKSFRAWHTHRKHRLTAAWRLINAFPFNIGSTQLNNNSARAMSLTVGFLYERYRFYTHPKYASNTKPIVGIFPLRNNIWEDYAVGTPYDPVQTLGDTVRTYGNNNWINSYGDFFTNSSNIA